MAEETQKNELKDEKKNNLAKTYHVSKRDDGKWQVKYAGGEKAIKLFETKAQAMEYTKKMAENQGRAVLVHASKGKFKGKMRSK